jgi:hypothetical protein
MKEEEQPMKIAIITGTRIETRIGMTTEISRDTDLLLKHS